LFHYCFVCVTINLCENALAAMMTSVSGCSWSMHSPSRSRTACLLNSLVWAPNPLRNTFHFFFVCIAAGNALIVPLPTLTFPLNGLLVTALDLLPRAFPAVGVSEIIEEDATPVKLVVVVPFPDAFGLLKID